MEIEEEQFKRLQNILAVAKEDRRPYWEYWRELARYTLPHRSSWLSSQREQHQWKLRNPDLLDGTSVLAINTLSSGLMNGITSPSRPWFRLTSKAATSKRSKAWLEDSTARMLSAMAESNFYTGLNIMFTDISWASTASMLILEDDETVFRAYNPPLGEFYLIVDDTQRVRGFAREFTWKVTAVAKRFGEDNLCETSKQALRSDGGNKYGATSKVIHLIEVNDDTIPDVASSSTHPYREVYWEEKCGDNKTVLEVNGFHEWPLASPRWDVTGADPYGIGPSMKALGDIKQLQQMTKRKLQAIDKMVNPPVQADIQLKNKPMSMMPSSVTFVAGGGNAGVRPVYQIQPDLQHITLEIGAVQQRIRDHYYNYLFQAITQLDTVRSAIEIQERKSENLVLLGPVLERVEAEALDPAVSRVFGIMQRKGLFDPDVPEELQGGDVEIKYSSILSEAQKAVGAAPIERLVGFLGNLAAAQPQVLDTVNWDKLVDTYAERLGVPADILAESGVIEQIREQRAAQQNQQAALEQAPVLAQSAKQLSDTEVGGAGNALDLLLSS